jgi:hypothetical protein
MPETRVGLAVDFADLARVVGETPVRTGRGETEEVVGETPVRTGRGETEEVVGETPVRTSLGEVDEDDLAVPLPAAGGFALAPGVWVLRMDPGFVGVAIPKAGHVTGMFLRLSTEEYGLRSAQSLIKPVTGTGRTAYGHTVRNGWVPSLINYSWIFCLFLCVWKSG